MPRVVSMRGTAATASGVCANVTPTPSRASSSQLPCRMSAAPTTTGTKCTCCLFAALAAGCPALGTDADRHCCTFHEFTAITGLLGPRVGDESCQIVDWYLKVFLVDPMQVIYG
jgi:hypothetical protein